MAMTRTKEQTHRAPRGKARKPVPQKPLHRRITTPDPLWQKHCALSTHPFMPSSRPYG